MAAEGSPGPERSESVGVAVTRGEGSDGPLSLLLKDRGARVLDWGTIGFAGPSDPAPFWSAMERLEEFDWICFSSPRAVDAVLRRVELPPEDLRVAAVGPSTANALRERDWPVHRYPEQGSGEDLLELFRLHDDVLGSQVLFPASEIAREVIPQGLTSLGARVHRVTAYRMVTLPLDPRSCRDAVDRGKVQAVTFASPSAMEGLRSALGEAFFAELAVAMPAAVMGATTAAALAAAGWQRVFVAGSPTLEGLAEAAVKAGRSRAGGGA